jgi:hypothetical protein
MTPLDEIAAERRRQVETGPGGEAYSAEHDDQHDMGELAGAAASYAISAMAKLMPAPAHELQKMAAAMWLLPDEVKQKHGARRMLVIAGALILAEIERLDRRPDIDRLLVEANAAFAALPPEEQEAQLNAQRESFVRGQLGMGNDAQEAADRAAFREREGG